MGWSRVGEPWTEVVGKGGLSLRSGSAFSSVLSIKKEEVKKTLMPTRIPQKQTKEILARKTKIRNVDREKQVYVILKTGLVVGRRRSRKNLESARYGGGVKREVSK